MTAQEGCCLALALAPAAPAAAAVEVPREARAVDTSRPDRCGGSGGALYADGNDRSGVLELRSSTLRDNPSAGFETDPGIFFLGREQVVVDSVVE